MNVPTMIMAKTFEVINKNFWEWGNVDKWFTVTDGWDLNLFCHEGFAFATLYKVNKGKTYTREGQTIAIFPLEGSGR